jgi:HEAT repeat protein
MKRSKKSAAKKSSQKTLSPVQAATSVVAATPVPAPVQQVDATSLPSPKTQPDVGGLVEQLRNGEFNSRLAAAAQLGTMRLPAAVDALKVSLRDSTAEVARESALALASDPSPATIAALTSVVENRDGYFHSLTRTAAIESLARIGDSSVVPVLLQAIRDPYADPSRAAIRALAALAPKEQTISALVQVVNNPDNYFHPSVRLAAVTALAGISELSIREFLQQVAANPNETPEMREAASR